MTGKILESLRKSYCHDLEFEEREVGRYMVHTGYTYPDGDELHIIIEKLDDDWFFTDDGHTIMWLSYSDFEIKGTRKTILEKTLKSNNVTIDDGVLYVKLDDHNNANLGASLKSMIQAEIQVADLLFLEKDFVKNTFMEDLRTKFSESEVSELCEYDYKIIDDEKLEYTADVMVRGEKPLLIFGIHTSLQCTRAIIAMMSLKGGNKKYMFMTVFDDDVKLEQNDFNKAVNESTKTTMGVEDAVNGAKMLLEL